MKNTKIEWAHHTVNFWWGCAKVSPACEHCYAESFAKYVAANRVGWGPSGMRWIRHEQARRELYALDLAAADRNVRERIFINSMSDTFEDRDDLSEARERLWDACRNITNLDILLLTKRPENVLRMVPMTWRKHWPAHVWIGTTVEDQKRAEERIPKLLEIPAKRRFLSCEPLLGEIEFAPIWLGGYDSCAGYHPKQIHWIIVGGESGGKSRPMEASWARGIRDTCKDFNVRFFFKQWGNHLPLDQCKAARVRLRMIDAMNHAQTGVPVRVGKKRAGRKLDNRTHSAVPSTPR